MSAELQTTLRQSNVNLADFARAPRYDTCNPSSRFRVWGAKTEAVIIRKGFWALLRYQQTDYLSIYLYMYMYKCMEHCNMGNYSGPYIRVPFQGLGLEP